jgi:glycosyltransferase involved in cell wall biosynthesis
LAKALRKPTVFVAGGTEVAVDPQIHGRDPRSAIRFIIAKAVIRFVDCIIPVSAFTLREVLAISAPRRYKIVYDAVDTTRFTPDLESRDDHSILTVALAQQYPPIDGLDRYAVKGLDRYARLQQILPDFKFHVLGSAGSDSRVRNLFPSGVCVVPLSDGQLVSSYQNATYYCQLSRYESFGIAVAEAMACECVPVVSNSGALPEVVGDCGLVVSNGDPILAAQLISANLGRTRSIGRRARNRILSKFSLETRANELKKVILTLVKQKEPVPPNC